MIVFDDCHSHLMRMAIRGVVTCNRYKHACYQVIDKVEGWYVYIFKKCCTTMLKD